ncbi:hypothetical protein cypCar_00049001, partial [Cyprinus carpio]
VKAVPRPLPPLPEDVLSVNSEQKGHSEKNRPSSPSSSTRNVPEQQNSIYLQNRPLSARERRRLKQLQENSRQQAASTVLSLDGKQTDQLDCPRPETKK